MSRRTIFSELLQLLTREGRLAPRMEEDGGTGTSGGKSLWRHAGPGLVSGIAQAALFNPYDRALYLSVVKKRPFLSAANFKHPFQGFVQVWVQRTIGGGLYFSIEDAVTSQCLNVMGDGSLTRGGVGLVAGAINGAILNPMSAVRYHMWGKDGAQVTGALRRMWRKGGIRPFMNGISVTMSRDTIFGMVYEVTRWGASGVIMNDPTVQPTFAINMSAAALATVASGPLNYVRNVKYSHRPHEVPDSALSILRSLKNKVMQQDGGAAKLRYLQQRLRYGWGTFRVALGMAVGSHIYRTAKDLLDGGG